MNPLSCVVLGCRHSITSANRPNSVCEFLNFPVGRKDLTEIWLRNLNLEGWTPGPESLICEEHFSMDSFETSDRGKFLKSNAVPTIVDDLDRIISLYEQELCSQYREFLESPTKTEKLRCRLCTVFICSGDAVNIHSDDGNIIKKIFQCIPILARTKTQDHLPKYICRLCLSDLNTCYRMQRRALESEEFFNHSLKHIKELRAVETTGQFVETDVYKSAVLADMTNTSNLNVPIDFDLIDSYTPDSISSFLELDRFEDNGPKLAAVEADGNNWSDENVTNSLKGPMSDILNTCLAPVQEPMEVSRQEKSPTACQQDTFKCSGNSSTSEICFTCQRCSTTYESKELLNRHLETHIISAWSEDDNIARTQDVSVDPENYCKIYAMSLPSRESSIQHSKKVHELKYIGDEAFQYNCEECGKVYKSKNSLIIHKRVHTGDRPFVCETCNRSFRSASNLQQHYLTHKDEKKFECGICGKTFARKNSLEAHSRVHTGERPYQCNVCSNKYTQLGDLNRHKRKCHKAPD